MERVGRFFCLLLLLGGMLACQAKVAPPKQVTNQQRTIKAITAGELLLKLKTGEDFILLDVREGAEYRDGHIEGAKLIPWMELRTRYKELDPDKEIVVYCHTGSRSKVASTILIFYNFYRISELHGGITSWQRRGYPLARGMPAYAR